MFKRSWIEIPAPDSGALICDKIYIVRFKRQKINKKDVGDGPFL